MRSTLERICIGALLVVGPAVAEAGSGTIVGRVEAMPARYLAETFVYLKTVEGSYSPKVIEIDQKGLSFSPHMATATVGDRVHFENHDSVFHNVYSKDEGGYNVGTFGPKQSGEHVFERPGVYAQLCSIHPEMLAYVFVGQNPYSAAVDKEGNFRIENVPEGTYQVAVWNPQLKAAEQAVAVAAERPATVSFLLKR